MLRSLVMFLAACTVVQATPFALTVEYLSAPLGVDVPKPRFSWKNAASSSSARGLVQHSYQLQVSPDEKFDDLMWDYETTSTQSFLLPYDGNALTSATKYFWRVRTIIDTSGYSTWSQSTFSTGLFGTADWAGAQWITGGDKGNLIRKEFEVEAVDPNAMLFISGIGYHEVYINGVKVGDHKLDSSWSDNSKRNYYASHSISAYLEPNRSNTIGVMMGNGWWSCDKGNGGGTHQPSCEDSPPQLLARLSNGEDSLVSDTTWKAKAGPITYNSLYNGEHYDARLEIPGWAATGLKDSSWEAATLANSSANKGIVASSLFEPIRIISSFNPLTMASPTDGVYVYDFGQNMAGIVRLTGLKCDAGVNVTLRHAELLMHPPYGPVDGSIYVGNLRNAKATDIYTCKGDPAGESFEPRFTQHGFRHVELSGLDTPLAFSQIEALEMHTDVSQHSNLAFSEGVDLLNKIHHAVVWGQKSNLMSVPTDCPQRDERRGWMGDAALTAEEAIYNFGMGAMLTKWLDQIQDDQQSSGAVTNFVPALGSGAGAPNWQSAYPSVIWAMFTYLGDTGPVHSHHDSLVRYYDYFISGYNKTGLKGFMTGFGDWVPPPPAKKADGHLVGAFAFLHDLKMGSEFFAGAGYAADAKRCADLYAKVKLEYHATFYDAQQGYYKSGLQTEQAMPLYLGVIPGEAKAAVLNYTMHDIQVTNTMHTTSGIIGIKCMLEALSAEGQTDLALDMVAKVDTYPSYGYMIQGAANPEPATTIWELWDSPTEGPGMNSRNHIMFGTVGSWFYKSLAGITPASAGYATANIAPKGIGHSNFTHADASVSTPYGSIHSSWSLDSQGHLTHTVTVPVGVSATVMVPVAGVNDARPAALADVNIQEGGVTVWAAGKYIGSADGIAAARQAQDAVAFTVGSGRFSFKVAF